VLVDDRGSERSLALAGIVAVVLLLVGGLIAGSPPKPDASAPKIARFLVDKSDQIRWGGFIAALGSIVLLAWLGAIWRLLRRAEGGTPMLAVGAALGAVMGAVLLNAAGVLLAVMAIIGPTAMGASATSFFYLLSNNLGSVGAMGLALFVGACSIVIIETGVVPKLLGWFGALVGVVLLASGGGIASTRQVFFVLTVIGFFGFVLWSFVLSVVMYRGAGAVETVPASAA
jgi:hypothetical protein